MGDKTWKMAFGERKASTAVLGATPDETVNMALSEAKRKRIEHATELEEAEHETKKAKLAKEKKDAEAAAAGDPNVGFKISGGVNLGTIDLQAQQREAREKLEKLEQENRASNQALANENSQLRETLHAQDIKFVEASLKSQIDNLGNTIKQNMNAGERKSFMEQYNETLEMAQKLGMQPGGGGAASDLQTQLSLKKLEFENQIALRRFDREMKAEDRRFSLELKKAEREDRYQQEKLSLEKQKMDSLFKAPETIGKIVAKAIMDADSGGVEGEAISGAIPLTADAGEFGEVPCPKCQTNVAIGPTGNRAVCAGCGQPFSITRNAPGSAPGGNTPPADFQRNGTEGVQI
jgi:hypothetical protein